MNAATALPTAVELAEGQARMGALIEKKYAGTIHGDGLDPQEEAELNALFAWQREVMDELARQFSELAPGEKAQLVALSKMRQASLELEIRGHRSPA